MRKRKIDHKSPAIRTGVTGDIRELNRRLLELSRQVAAKSRTHAIVQSPPGKILISFFEKAVNTFAAIEVLKAQRLIEEAWILLRVLLETHVNLLFFIRGDGAAMTQRYADALLLDKLKQLREVNFYEGTAAARLHRRQEWEQTETEINGRYTPEELKDLRRNGFSGLPFEQRARAVGLKSMYDNCYRIASRSVHMFDPAETLLSSDAFRGQRKERTELLRLRRQELESNQNMLMGRLAYIMSELVDAGLISAQLFLLGLGYEKFRDRTTGPVKLERGEAADPAGTIRVWRE